MSDLTHSDSTVIAASPETVYDIVSDITRVGEWSPECRTCWWDEGATGKVGDWFTGRNESQGHSWETRSRVVAAERGKEFAFQVGGTYVRWGFSMVPAESGTTLTESWAFLPDGITFFKENFGGEADAMIAARTESAHTGIAATLAAVKKIAEG